MSNKILCVDDEPNVLQGFKRMLRKDYAISVAEGGEQALALMETEGPFAVIVSDMQMPHMNGVEFLRRVKEVSPDTVTIMLTGNSDQQTAMDAVNESSIYRFLSKPCTPEFLSKTLDVGLEQFRLIKAEKNLLEETLNKSMQVLVDMLAMVNPPAFNRSTRVKKLAREIADKLAVKNFWAVELAAMLSQIGCVTLPDDILQKVADGVALTRNEADLYQQHPQTGRDLILKIPRMETVAEIVARQNRRNKEEAMPKLKYDEVDDATLGARILKVVLDFDRLIVSGNLPGDALKELAARAGWYDSSILENLRIIIEESAEEYIILELGISQLKPGMILDEDLRSKRGSMFVKVGQEITVSLILRLMNYSEAGMIINRVQVKVPVKQIRTKSAQE